MSIDGGTALATRIGGRPTAQTKSGCAECGHPYALHSNATTPCQAFACTAGPNGQPCQGFTVQAA